MLGHGGGGGGSGGEILCNKPIFLWKINSAGAGTLDLFVGIVKCLCG